MRVAVLGGGTIARLMLEHRAELPGIAFVALVGWRLVPLSNTDPDFLDAIGVGRTITLKPSG